MSITVTKGKNEAGGSLIKRFTQKMNQSGVIPKKKSIRYAQRDLSAYKNKKATLKKIVNQAKISEMLKMGKPVVFKK